jgi:hypothetical protein
MKKLEMHTDFNWKTEGKNSLGHLVVGERIILKRY